MDFPSTFSDQLTWVPVRAAREQLGPWEWHPGTQSLWVIKAATGTPTLSSFRKDGPPHWFFHSNLHQFVTSLLPLFTRMCSSFHSTPLYLVLDSMPWKIENWETWASPHKFAIYLRRQDPCGRKYTILACVGFSTDCTCYRWVGEGEVPDTGAVQEGFLEEAAWALKLCGYEDTRGETFQDKE